MSAGDDDRLIEPITPREREVLQLLSEGLSDQEIAARLVLSIGTVKWHLKNLYGKLGVERQGQAVRRARELGLLEGGISAVKGYQLQEQIGSGRLGNVYRANHPLLKHPVAIKVIRTQYANHPDFIRRFEVEAEFVARLEHPHIVPLYDYWREPDGAYLVMRWLGGGSLRHALERGRWDTTRVARLVEEMCAALSVAHRHGVVHRSIKPENILLDEGGNAYIADFRIPKDFDRKLTQNALNGDTAYFAPEQLLGETVTAKTDQYSFRIILLEALTGHNPLSQGLTTGAMKEVIDQPLLLQEIQLSVPDPLAEVLQRATAENPDARQVDMLQLAAAFDQAIAAAPAKMWLSADNTDDLHSSTSAGKVYSSASVEQSLINPYKGLRAFQEADAADFFGRSALVEQLIQRMSETGEAARFPAVVGPSGSGKSSAVKAGLIPRLRQGALPHSDTWFVAQIMPGANPLQELETALLRTAVNPPDSLLDELSQDVRGLLHAAQRILPADQSELVLIVDQFVGSPGTELEFAL